jgi:DNA-binding transcriptional MocR family regulator
MIPLKERDPDMKAKTNALYEEVAGKMAHLIGYGTYRTGDRVPSIRDISRSMKVSISTALEAYRLLEVKGLIEARPQSGYYVSPPRLKPVTEPKLSRAEIKPAEASLTEIAQVIVRDASNPDFFNLGMATPSADVLPAKRLNRILASVVRAKETVSVSYLFSDGYEPLRKQIAQRAILAGCPLTPDEIIVTTGCHEAIAITLRALCRPGDAVAIESPFFFNHLQAMAAMGLKIVEIPSSPKEGINLEALGYALEQTPVKACLVSANYSNPTGSCMPDHRKKALVKMLAGKQIPLIEDDIYGDLSFSDTRPRAAKSFDEQGLVVLCSSFSKTLAPGYRVGWVAPGRFHQVIRYQRMINTLAPASPTQMAIAEFLTSGGYERHLRRVRRIYEKQLGQMLEALRRHFPEGTRTTRPEGSFIFWVELPEGVDSLEMFRRAREKGISIAPGPIFSNSGKYRNFLRLNAAHFSPKVERALETLGGLALEQVS